MTLKEPNCQSPDRSDELFLCLADSERRQLIAYLSNKSTPLPIESLTQRIMEERTKDTDSKVSAQIRQRIAISLYHSHLPKLEEAGILEINYETNLVREGEDFEKVTDILQTE